MRQLILTLITVVCISFQTQAQNNNFNQDFELLAKGDNILKLQKKKFTTWGKSTWTVSETEGQGNNKSNKFASSGAEENATLVLYKDLEVGSTYVFSVAVKMTNAQGAAWKTNYSVKVTAGKKGDIHVYGEDKVKEPGENKWKTHKMEFTVVEGREKVALQVYRWAKGVTLNIDDFKLIKK